MAKARVRGTAAVRFELLWRDYMRLCTRKFGPRLFRDWRVQERYELPVENTGCEG